MVLEVVETGPTDTKIAASFVDIAILINAETPAACGPHLARICASQLSFLPFSESDVAGKIATGQVTRERRRKPSSWRAGPWAILETQNATDDLSGRPLFLCGTYFGASCFCCRHWYESRGRL
jgi:hypothetical protein